MVDVRRRHHPESAVPMLSVVPGKKDATVTSRILDATELSRKAGMVLHGFELRLGVRIVIRHVRPAVGFRHAEVRQQKGHGLAGHA